jgi:hypothetical protein
MNVPSTRRAGLLVGLLLFALPATARADFFVIPFAGIKFGGSTSIVDLELAAGKNKLVLGVAALKIGSGIIGFEGEFGNMSGFFSNPDIEPLVKGGSYVNDLTGSVVLTLPPGVTGGGLRPYGIVGAGFVHAEAEDILEVLQVRRTVPVINLGVGAIGMLTNNVGLRFDVRHLRSLSSDPSIGGVGRRIAYSRFTIGVLLRP